VNLLEKKLNTVYFKNVRFPWVTLYNITILTIVLQLPTLFSTTIYCTRCDNLIPGIVAACRWVVESCKLVYSSTFGHVPTCVYMSHRPNESFVPEQQRKKYVSVVYDWRKNE